MDTEIQKEGLHKIDIQDKFKKFYNMKPYLFIGEDSFPIMVSDEDGESFEFDMADIDEFDPVFTLMDRNTMGIA